MQHKVRMFPARQSGALKLLNCSQHLLHFKQKLEKKYSNAVTLYKMDSAYTFWHNAYRGYRTVRIVYIYTFQCSSGGQEIYMHMVNRVVSVIVWPKQFYYEGGLIRITYVASPLSLFLLTYWKLKRMLTRRACKEKGKKNLASCLGGLELPNTLTNCATSAAYHTYLCYGIQRNLCSTPDMSKIAVLQSISLENASTTYYKSTVELHSTTLTLSC